MSDLIDGSGVVITDGSGASLFDGDGATAATPVTVTTNLDPFIQRIQMDIPDAPDFVISPILKDILREFTGKAWVLYQGIQVQGSGAATSTNKSVAWDMATYIDWLEPIGIKDLQDSYGSYDAKQKTLATSVADTRYKINGVKFYEVYKSEEDGNKTNIRIYPFDSDPLLSMMVAFKTLPDATEVPEILVDDYRETICHGVFARMMTQPGKPWTDPNLALFHKGEYNRGIGEANLKWFKNNGRVGAVGKRFV